MSWNGHFLDFKTFEDAQDYIALRLTNPHQIAPVFDESRGGAPEDVLISYYRRESSNEHKKWFWSICSEISSKAWDDLDVVTFQTITSLILELPIPDNPDGFCNFLPKESAEFCTRDEEKFDIFSLALTILLGWNIIPEKSFFWKELFNYYLSIMPECELLPPVISAYNGLGHMMQGEQNSLQWYASRKEPYPHDLLTAILDDQKYLCDHEPKCEISLLEEIENSELHLIMATKNPLIQSKNLNKNRRLVSKFVEQSSWSENIDSERKKMRIVLERPTNVNPKLYALGV